MSNVQRIAGTMVLMLVAACGGGGGDDGWGSWSYSSSKTQWYKNCRWDESTFGTYLYYHCVATTQCDMSDVCSGYTEGMSGCRPGQATCTPYEKES